MLTPRATLVCVLLGLACRPSSADAPTAAPDAEVSGAEPSEEPADLTIPEDGSPPIVKPTAIRAQQIYSPDPSLEALAHTKAAMEGVPVETTIRYCIDTRGRAVDLEVKNPSGDPDVDEICRSTVETWRFKPFMIDEKPHMVCTHARFVLRFMR